MTQSQDNTTTDVEAPARKIIDCGKLPLSNFSQMGPGANKAGTMDPRSQEAMRARPVAATPRSRSRGSYR